MFFLGASANILAYILVSAFFISCLCCKGQEKESGNFMPLMIRYETVASSPADASIHFYSRIETKTEPETAGPTDLKLVFRVSPYVPPLFSLFYRDDFSLRAPPSLPIV